MPARTSKRLKQNIPRCLRLSGSSLRLSRLLGPQSSQRFERRLQLIACEMNRQKRQHQMKTVRIAAKQNEIVIVTERRKPRFARVWQVPSPSKRDAPRTSALLQTACNNDVRLIQSYFAVKPRFSFADIASRPSGLLIWQPGILGYNRKVAPHPVSGAKGGSRDSSQRFS